MQRLALWGHHLDEYQDMFDLTPKDLNGRLLEYGCGASAVNTEMNTRGLRMTSYDPWFLLSQTELETLIRTSFESRLAQVKADQEKFDVSRYGSFDELIRYRHAGIEQFLIDYQQGREDMRYHVLENEAALPLEPFEFDIAVSAHYLFTDQAQLEHHLAIIKELARVAKEVRIFPLIDREGIPSKLLGPILLGLQQANFGVEVRNVSYHLQPKGNAMLRVWAQQCIV